MRIGTVSYNIYCNFTNYGSALQTWALHQVINRLGSVGYAKPRWEAILVDYCPDCLLGKNPLDPMNSMWDADEESRRLCELSLPAIRVNAEKFDDFYAKRMSRTSGAYKSSNFDDVAAIEGIDGFVCGSDTIFCPDEFGIDDGFYANYASMRGHSIAYAASFGDPHFDEGEYAALDMRLRNFLAIGLREGMMIPYIEERVEVPVRRVVDPTLLLEATDYDGITAEKQEDGDYLLLYSRRYNPEMEKYAESLAARKGWKVVEISLRAENASRHRMFYEAGIEEFLALVRDARFVVTNSYHGMIFAYQFRTPFYVFSREQCDSKISELLCLMGLSDRLITTIPASDEESLAIDWGSASMRVASARGASLVFLEDGLDLLCGMAGK